MTRLLGYLGRYRARYAAGALCLAATASLAMAVPYLLKRAIDAISRGEPASRAANYALVIIAVSVFSQVVARYVFEVALHWTEEVAAISMVWAVYMGASLCVRERFHIRIIVAVKALPDRVGKVVVFLADIIWVFFSVFTWISK